MNTRTFRQWIAQYTNGSYKDYLALSAARQNELFNAYKRDSQDAWGEPCGKGLIDIKTPTPKKERLIP